MRRGCDAVEVDATRTRVKRLLADGAITRGTEMIPAPGAGEPFVGWVQPSAGGLGLVGCTHPTMTRSLQLAGSL